MTDYSATAEGMSWMMRNNYIVCTVADLSAQVAGLPPMMNVFVDADGKSMYMNWSEVQEADGHSPFLRLICSEFPKRPPFADSLPKTYAQLVDEQRQRAMQMGHNQQEAQKMPSMVR